MNRRFPVYCLIGQFSSCPSDHLPWAGAEDDRRQKLGDATRSVTSGKAPWVENRRVVQFPKGRKGGKAIGYEETS